MNKKQMLLTIASGAILALGLGACANNGPANTSSLPDESTSETVIEKELRIVSEPTKKIYVVGEYLDYSGLSVKKYTTTDGVSDEGVTMSSEALSFSHQEGSVVSEVQNLVITVADKNEESVKSASFTLTVKDKETYTVTFENYDGTTLYSTSAKEGTVGVTYEGETPTRDKDDTYYYRFKNWYLKGDASKSAVDLSSVTFSSNITLVADYTSYEASSTDGTYKYAYFGDGYAVTGFASSEIQKGTTEITNIPATFNDAPVNAIAEGAFKQILTITKVVIPSNIKTIEKQAFYGCKGIAELDLGNGVETIANEAFRSAAMSTLLIPSSVKTIEDEAFYNTASLASITFSEGLETLGEDAFNGCAVTELSLPDSLTNITVKIGTDKNRPEGSPFSSFELCEKITFGSGLSAETIAKSGINEKFYSALKTVAVRENNDKLAVVDNVLYSKDMSQLCIYPTLSADLENIDEYRSTFTIPDSVTEILPGAFYGNSTTSHLSTINFGSGVKTIDYHAFYQRQGNCQINFNNAPIETIGNYAFYYMVGGTEKSGTSSNKTTWKITLPSTVKSVGDGAFGGNQYLTDFVFSKSMETFGTNIFANSSKLKNISFPEDSTYDISEDRAFVYANDRKKVIWHNSSVTTTSYEMPDTVEEVAPFLLEKVTKITSLTLSKNLKIVGESAFSGMSGVANELTLPDTLTSVGANGFKNMSKVTKINFPSSLTNIGKSAFYGLKVAEIGKLTIGAGATVGEKAFSNCTGITELTLNATSIGESAFSICTALTSVTLSDEIEALPDSLFSGNTALTTINMPSKLKSIGSSVFSGTTALTSELSLPETLETISDKAFEKSSFASVTVPSSVTSFGKSAFNEALVCKVVLNNDFEILPDSTFYKCANLAEFELKGTSIKEIGKLAFSECTSLTSVTLPSSVTTLGEKSFSTCTKLESFTGKGVSDISASSIFYGDAILTTLVLGDFTETGSMVFYNCAKLTNIPTPSSYVKLGSNAYYGTGITSFTMTDNMTFDASKGSPFSGASKLESVSLNASVTKFTNSLFKDCSSLTTVTTASTITDIGSNAFYNCSSLVSAPIDLKTATSIGGSAFYNCSSLTSIDLPETEAYSKIENYTFYGCKGISDVVIPGNISKLSPSSFQNCSALTTVTINNVNTTFDGSFTSYAKGVFNNTSINEIRINATKAEAATFKSLLTAKTVGLKANSTLTLTYTDGSETLSLPAK